MKVFVSICVICLSQVVFSQTTLSKDNATNNATEVNMLTRPIHIKAAVYPNPSTDIVYRSIQNDAEVQVEFRNIKGEVVNRYPSDIKYDIRHLPNGIYYIYSLDNDENVLSYNKFVKN